MSLQYVPMFATIDKWNFTANLKHAIEGMRVSQQTKQSASGRFSSHAHESYFQNAQHPPHVWISDKFLAHSAESLRLHQKMRHEFTRRLILSPLRNLFHDIMAGTYDA